MIPILRLHEVQQNPSGNFEQQGCVTDPGGNRHTQGPKSQVVGREREISALGLCVYGQRVGCLGFHGSLFMVSLKHKSRIRAQEREKEWSLKSSINLGYPDERGILMGGGSWTALSGSFASSWHLRLNSATSNEFATPLCPPFSLRNLNQMPDFLLPSFSPNT